MLAVRRGRGSRADLLKLLGTPSGGDASLILAKQSIAAKLNVARFSNSAAAAATIGDADRLLADYSGQLPFGVSSGSSAGEAMTADGATLADYNNGALTPGCAP